MTSSARRPPTKAAVVGISAPMFCRKERRNSDLSVSGGSCSSRDLVVASDVKFERSWEV